MALTVEQMARVQALTASPDADFEEWFTVSGLDDWERPDALQFWDDMEQAWRQLPPGHTMGIPTEW